MTGTWKYYYFQVPVIYLPKTKSTVAIIRFVEITFIYKR